MSNTHYIRVWKAKDGWRWFEMKSSDKVAESGEGYKRRADAIAKAKAHGGPAIRLIIDTSSGRSIAEVDDAA